MYVQYLYIQLAELLATRVASTVHNTNSIPYDYVLFSVAIIFMLRVNQVRHLQHKTAGWTPRHSSLVTATSDTRYTANFTTNRTNAMVSSDALICWGSLTFCPRDGRIPIGLISLVRCTSRLVVGSLLERWPYSWNFLSFHAILGS